MEEVKEKGGGKNKRQDRKKFWAIAIIYQEA